MPMPRGVAAANIDTTVQNLVDEACSNTGGRRQKILGVEIMRSESAWLRSNVLPAHQKLALLGYSIPMTHPRLPDCKGCNNVYQTARNADTALAGLLHQTSLNTKHLEASVLVLILP
eukprot:GHUV01046186.1.p1 GENE.GHUV01046186.1~~GHUV01046186.1.p1  ORF type:complete len:117 (-),score=8.77 GHUV01046186.1:177-527(-)